MYVITFLNILFIWHHNIKQVNTLFKIMYLAHNWPKFITSLLQWFIRIILIFAYRKKNTLKINIFKKRMKPEFNAKYLPQMKTKSYQLLKFQSDNKLCLKYLEIQTLTLVTIINQ